jgi:hypothetical protein
MPAGESSGGILGEHLTGEGDIFTIGGLTEDSPFKMLLILDQVTELDPESLVC